MFQDGIAELKVLSDRVQKSQTSTKETLLSAICNFEEDKENLLQTSSSELESLREQKDAFLQDLHRQHKRHLEAQANMQRSLAEQKEQMDLEQASKEQLFQERYQQKEGSLAEQALALRTEVAKWNALKEQICQKQKQLEELYVHLVRQSELQQRERSWLIQKQEVDICGMPFLPLSPVAFQEVKRSVKENRRLADVVKKDLGARNSAAETCKLLKKQIELTIQFHQERGAVVEYVYWDSKRSKACIPRSSKPHSCDPYNCNGQQYCSTTGRNYKTQDVRSDKTCMILPYYDT